MTLRVGIIGAGQAGERHAVGFAACEDAQLVAVADIDQGRAETLATRFEAKAFTDWRTLLDETLDILVVSLPHNMHVAPAEAAAARGVHVLMEKPIATTLEDAKRIVQVCEGANVKLSISFVHRFREELQVAKGWLEAGHVGTVQVARESMGGQRGAHLPKWVTQQDIAGGGVLMYSAIHGLDRLRWLIGSEVVHVTAQTRTYNPNTDVEDGVAALLTFANGATATLTSNAPVYRAQPARWETELYGDTAFVRIRTRQFTELSSDDMTEHVDTAAFSEKLGIHYNFARQAQAFVEAIREDTTPAITGEDGVKALELAFAIYQAADTGEGVRLEHKPQ
ncbi:MAG: Gfo/Idh/MocA family oxidoreductase [Deinococcota bacterium]